jgi:DNA-binding XRE family transcriptional regulator
MEDRRITNSFPDALIPILRQLGSDLACARKVREMTQAMLADRLHVSRKVVVAMEKGDPRVNFGSYALAAWTMGLEDGIKEIFSSERDPVFQREARLGLPERVRVAAATRSPLGDLDF